MWNKIKKYFTKVVVVEIRIPPEKGEIVIENSPKAYVWLVNHFLKIDVARVNNYPYHLAFRKDGSCEKAFGKECLHAFYDEQSAREWLCKELDKRKRLNCC